MYHRSLPEYETYDEIRMKVIPRYKTSGLSGDEWRTSIKIEFCFKGQVVKTTSASTMKTAILMLGYESIEMFDDKTAKIHAELEKECCDQPGCSNKAVARFKLKKLTADNGEYLDMNDQYGEYYRKFCSKHLQRGDCGREDADDNYIPLDDKTPEDTTNTKTSPSEFGGVIIQTDYNPN
jgi:hypothetical protein